MSKSDLPFTRRNFLQLTGSSLVVPSVASLLGACGGKDSAGSDAGPDAGLDSGIVRGDDITFVLTRNRGVAPAGFMFTALANTLDVERPFHDVRYKWTFEDEGRYTRLAEDLPWGRSRNVAYGPVVAHTFENPGTYQVRCEATDGVETVAESFSVIVDDPDQVFSADKTICLSPEGNFEGAPEGATTLQSLGETLSSLDRSKPLRILFHRGEEHTDPLPFLSDFGDVQVGAYGTGDPPILRFGINFRRCSGDVAVYGLDFRGSYDPTDPENTTPSGNAIILVAEGHETVHDCGFSGWSINIRPHSTEPASLVVSNTSIRDWFDYGLLHGSSGWLGLAGVSIRQHPRTVRAQGKGESEAPFHADHGPFRLSRPNRPVCFNLVDLFTTNSWAGATHSVQPGIRWNSGGVDSVQQLVLDRVRSEGGSFTLNPGSAGAQPGAMEVIVDKFHHITTTQPVHAGIFAHGGTTVRNGILVQASVLPESTTGLRTMIGVIDKDPLPSNAGEPKEVYNCTLVDLRNPETAVTRDFAATTDRNEGEYYFANHVYYAPDAGTPQTADLPLDLSSRWQPLYEGRYVAGEDFDPSFANPASTAALFQPTRESAAFQAATGKAALDDFFGNLRGPNPSRGALEPGSTPEE